jgi:hypothetical protein
VLKRKRKEADHVLLVALACGSTIENAAVKAGVGHSTVSRRLGDPVFAKKLQDMKSGMVRRTAAMLTAAASESVKTLLELQSQISPPAVRLGAARAIVELGAKLRETAELQDRISALEQQLAGDGWPPLVPPPEAPPPTSRPDAPETSSMEAAA